MLHTLFPLLAFLSLLTSASAAYIPSPYPSATTSPSAPLSAIPAPTAAPLVPRCNDGDCSGGTAMPLQADTVTSTILSITSVPCYITTFVTNEKTVTSTMYNTETVTETVTKEGKVFIVQYAPVPIVKSTKVAKVVQVTVDVELYWVESGAPGGFSTVKEEWTTKASGGRPDCPTCIGSGKPAQPQPQPQQQGGPAWTHVVAAPAANTPVAGHVQGDGWAAAAGGGAVVAGGSGTTWGNAQANGQGTWQSAAGPRKAIHRQLAVSSLGLALGSVVLGELSHML